MHACCARWAAALPVCSRPSSTQQHRGMAAAPAPPPRPAAASTPGGGSSSSSSDALDWSRYNQRWHDIWEGGLQPGQLFDKGCCSPSLLQLLDSKQLDVKGKRVLVPGCGRGYDVVAFAAAGAAQALGLDICPSAITAAAAERDARLAGQPAAAAAAQLAVGDFFTLDAAACWRGGGTSSTASPVQELQAQQAAHFDTGYDYTFFCALHPGMRRAWADAWARLLAPGSGLLVTMVYPVDASLGEGPPWPVTPQLYKETLLPAGFSLESLAPIPAEQSHPARAGREWLGIWRRLP